MNTYHNALPQGERHPLTAAFLSVIPGLGQFYVGDKRKGMLFLDVAIINYVLLMFVAFAIPLQNALSGLAARYRFTVNHEILGALQNAQFGSPASLCLIGLMIAFISFAARDAYDKAFGINRKQIYGDSIIDLSEATSGSYIAHISLMLSFLLLAILFVRPPMRIDEKSIVEFEFDQKQIEKIKPPVTNRVSNRDVKAQGKRKPDVPVKVAHKSEAQETKPAEQKTAPQQPAQEKVASAPPAPTPTPVRPTPPASVSKPMPTPTPMPMVASAPPTVRTLLRPAVTRESMLAMVPQAVMVQTNPVPTPAPLAANSMTKALAAPMLMPSAPSSNIMPSAMPLAVSPFGSSAAPPALPSPTVSAGTGTAAGIAPAPMNITAGSSAAHGTAAGAPNVVAVGGKPGGSAAASKIEPSRANCIGCGGSGGFSVVPRFVGPSSGGGKMAPASGARGGERDGVTNPDSDTAGDPAVNTRKDVDFSRYMAELQRKIKRQWFPPKGPESNRIRVLFQVSRDGTMSGLKLVNSSGNALADKAATNAVETAQPFPPLPAGAPESVDIEFTFDFNVFTR